MENDSGKTTDISEIILNEALKEFSKNGFYNCNVDQIAKAAGVGKGTIYRRFGDKDQLFKAVLINFMEGHLIALEDFLPTGVFEEDLFSITEIIIPDLFNNRDFFKLIFHYESKALEQYGEKYFNTKQQHDQRARLSELLVIKKIVDKAKEKGNISKNVDARIIGHIFWSFVHGLFREATIMQSNLENIRQYTINFVKILKAGINSLY